MSVLYRNNEERARDELIEKLREENFRLIEAKKAYERKCKQLEKNITELKQIKHRRTNVDTYPDSLLEQFPKLLKAVTFEPKGGQEFELKRIHIDPRFLNAMSTIVKRTVFASKITKYNGSQNLVDVKDMDDAEYDFWLSTVGCVLKTLDAALAVYEREFPQGESDG